MSKSIHNFVVKKIDGKTTPLKEFEGKVLLIVNVASKCGLTSQYDALEELHEEYHDRGLEVLGFPANEFGSQEPGTNAEIQEFCRSNFGVEFPMFEKIVVKGKGIHPLYQLLTETQPQATSPKGNEFEDKLKGYGITRENKTDILWNFEKFLVDRSGKIIARFNPDVEPLDPVVTDAIEAALA